MSLVEILTELFEVSEEKAREVFIPIRDFEDKLSQLECFVGFDTALDILQNGEFLRYCTFGFNDYINLVRQASGKMNYDVRDSSVFYSVDALNQYLNPSIESENIFGLIKMHKYKLLADSSEQSRGYF